MAPLRHNWDNLAEWLNIKIGPGCVWIALSSIALNPLRQGLAAPGPETTPSKGAYVAKC